MRGGDVGGELIWGQGVLLDTWSLQKDDPYVHLIPRKWCVYGLCYWRWAGIDLWWELLNGR